MKIPDSLIAISDLLAIIEAWSIAIDEERLDDAANFLCQLKIWLSTYETDKLQKRSRRSL